MGRYQKATREVRDAGDEGEDMHITYAKQVAGLNALHKDVIQGLDQLRVQTETLQRVEDTIRSEQEKLRATCEQLEDKQSQYQATVLAALEETDHVLSLCGLKRGEELDA
jgi:DNA repair ATPase RecN